MATEPLKSSILSLSDLELATLLCLTSAQHALVSTPTAHLSDLESELRLIATHVFGLSVAAVTCDAESDAQDFLEDVVGVHVGRETRRRGRGERGEEGGLPRLPNVLLLSGLWRASRAVQVQVLELIRQRRLRTATSKIDAPEHFIILILVPDDDDDDDGDENVRLNEYLTDALALAHHHDPTDGFPNLEEASDPYYDFDTDPNPNPPSPSSSSSSPRPRPAHLPDYRTPLTPAFPPSSLSTLLSATKSTTLTAPIRGYMQSITIFLRMHRATAPAGGGISPKASRHFEGMAKALAALHGLRYVTPDVVKLAARKVFRHRVVIARPEEERSVQWGTGVGDARVWLRGWDAERVVEDVLETVDCPA